MLAPRGAEGLLEAPPWRVVALTRDDGRRRVLVAFEAGDPARPCVLGALWHAQARPPQAVAADGDQVVATVGGRLGEGLRHQQRMAELLAQELDARGLGADRR